MSKSDRIAEVESISHSEIEGPAVMTLVRPGCGGFGNSKPSAFSLFSISTLPSFYLDPTPEPFIRFFRRTSIRAPKDRLSQKRHRVAIWSPVCTQRDPKSERKTRPTLGHKFAISPFPQ